MSGPDNECGGEQEYRNEVLYNECGVVLESMDEALIMNGYGKGVHV